MTHTWPAIPAVSHCHCLQASKSCQNEGTFEFTESWFHFGCISWFHILAQTGRILEQKIVSHPAKKRRSLESLPLAAKFTARQTALMMNKLKAALPTMVDLGTN